MMIKILYIFFAYKNMSLSDLIKRANQQQSTIEIKVEPKKQEALVDVEQKIEKIDPPTKKVGKTIEVLPEDENIKKLYSLLEAILEKRM